MTGVSTWSAPLAEGPVRGTVAVPGSKSITNRALLLAALAADGATRTLAGARASRIPHSNADGDLSPTPVQERKALHLPDQEPESKWAGGSLSACPIRRVGSPAAGGVA